MPEPKEDKKLFYVQMPVVFFNSTELTIIDRMPNGKLIKELYTELLLKAAPFNGFLMVNDGIPLDADSIATILNLEKGFVQEAIETLISFKLLEREDGKLFVPEVVSLTKRYADNPNAKRQRRYYDNQKAVRESNASVRNPNENYTQNNSYIHSYNHRPKKESIYSSDASYDLEAYRKTAIGLKKSPGENGI